MNRHRLARLLTLALALAISLLALAPLPPLAPPPGWSYGDKLQHVLAFAALVFPLACLDRPTLPTLVLLAAAFGAMIEILQPPVGREGAFGDFLADLLGIAIGVALATAARRKRPLSAR